MNELMKHCGSSLVPFYLENPQMSKLWHHPIIRKWTQHPASQKVEFDYCQFGTDWKKGTTILSVGNLEFHAGHGVKCKVVWHNGSSTCSRTGKPHETLTGFINGAPKGQYNTNKACPYPLEFCTHVAKLVAQPQLCYKRKVGENPGLPSMPIGPKVSLDLTPPEHCLTHLPKHPGCKACMTCKVQHALPRQEQRATEEESGRRQN